MNSKMKMPAFLARPMRKMDQLEASFFSDVQDVLVRPALTEAARDLGYDFELFIGAPVSSTQMFHDILARLESAHLAIFDITGLNDNVLIEYGYRRARGDSHLVVIACRGIGLDLPFDLRHQNVFLYGRDEIESGVQPSLVSMLSARIKDTLRLPLQKLPLANTDQVYNAYDELTDQDDLFIWVATWPAFPGSFKERILVQCHARTIVIAGPINSAAQLPGVFWRLDIRERRSKLGSGPFYIYGRPLPPMKIIIAGGQSFLAPEPIGRTARYYCLGHTAGRFTTMFQDELEGARMIEEEIYRFFFDRLHQMGGGVVDSLDVMRAFEEDSNSVHASPEATSYNPDWVLAGIRKWVPRCVEWVVQNRGWKALSLEKKQGQDFALSLRRGGEWLERRHHLFLIPGREVFAVPAGREKMTLPRLRIVATNRCDLGCSYCPPENEDYGGGSGAATLRGRDLALILGAAARCGFHKFSITGGEPLLPDATGEMVVSTLREFARNGRNGPATFAVQTNGRHLGVYLDKLEPIRSKITLKVSIDTVQSVARVAKATVVGQVTESVKEARRRGFGIGLNFVLTRDTSEQLQHVARWARDIGVYVKVLDLNWYEDLGLRHTGMGALPGDSWADIYWKEQYLPPLKFYETELAEEFGGLREVRLHYGVPMFDTVHEPNGFFIRIKDSGLGSHYAPQCRTCPFFVDKRRCQEGVYQPWITPGLRLKICRHRSDLHEDLSDVLRDGDAEALAGRIIGTIKRFYSSSKFVTLE